MIHPNARRALTERATSVFEGIEERPLSEIDFSRFSYVLGSRLFVFSDLAIENFRGLLNDLLMQKGWNDRFSLHYLEDELGEIFKQELLAKDKPMIAELFDAFLTFADQDYEERVVFLPVQSLHLNVEKLNIGKMAFKTSTDALFSEMLVKTRTPESYFFSHNRCRTICEVRVKAEAKRAIAYAEEVTRLAVDVLRFAMTFVHRPGLMLSFGLPKDAIDGQRAAIAFVESHPDDFVIAPVGFGTDVRIDAHTLSALDHPSVKRLLKVAAADETEICAFDRILLRALQNFSAALQQLTLTSRVRDFITSIETVVETGGGIPIQRTVAEAVAFTLQSGYEERRRFRERMVALYGLRSKISHGEDCQITPADAIELEVITRDFLAKLLAISEHQLFSEKSDFSRFIDCLRLT